MKSFLRELKSRNKILYYFGWYNLLAGTICLLLIPFDEVQILGISRWIKPVKFFLSVWIMVWSMGWMMYYLNAIRGVKVCSWLIVIFMFFENFIITMQSARGITSHFNSTNTVNLILFNLMGVAIGLFTITIIYILILFLRQKQFLISSSYVWGIRLGILLFIIFSSEGGMMVENNAHTVGAPDGGEGLPLVNWSKKYGDLRVAHFFGMHALQIIPLFSYYLAKTKRQVIIFSILYFFIVSAIFVQAMYKIPMLP